VTGPAVQIGSVLIQRAAIFTIVALVICAGFLFYFVNRTRLGRAMQATSQDPDTARLMGINVDRSSWSPSRWAQPWRPSRLGPRSALYRILTSRWGFLAGLKAFTAAVLGVLATSTALCSAASCSA
jgi:branched-chain amino acid transport system permease protein